MNKHLRKFAFCLSVLLAVAGCSQAPKEVNGQPVYEVPFEQPLVLKPETGQDFYFYIKGKDKERYHMILLINMVIPYEEIQTSEQVSKLIELDRKWLTHHGSKPGKEALLFDVKVEYHTEGTVIPILLKHYVPASYKANKTGWHRLGISGYSHYTRELNNGKNVQIDRKKLANFNPYDIPPEKDGFYKVSVKPVAGVHYPTQFDLEFSVWPDYPGK